MTAASQSLAGRVALVTGGGSGIGLGIAKGLAGAGADVVVAGRTLDKLEAAMREIENAGGRALARQTDVRSFEEVSATVAAAVETFGGLDIMVANAAGNFVVPTHEMSVNAWKTVIDIDLNGTFYCAKAGYDALKASPHGGRFIAISTMRAMEGWPGCAHAAAAKAGVMSLVRTLAAEWGAHGICCNTIAPGPIGDTEGVKRIYADADLAAAELSSVPLGRFGSVTDIANAAIFLCSDAGSYISGADLVVDGGRQRGRGRAFSSNPERLQVS